MDAKKLPPLPEPWAKALGCFLYNADQMRDYALAAVAAELAALRDAGQAVVDAYSSPNAKANLRGHWLHLSDCLLALRAAIDAARAGGGK